jgi:hypothetical protein
VLALTLAALLALVVVGDGSRYDPTHRHRCRCKGDDNASITHARPPEPKNRFVVNLAWAPPFA